MVIYNIIIIICNYYIYLFSFVIIIIAIQIKKMEDNNRLQCFIFHIEYIFCFLVSRGEVFVCRIRIPGIFDNFPE